MEEKTSERKRQNGGKKRVRERKLIHRAKEKIEMRRGNLLSKLRDGGGGRNRKRIRG